MTDSLPVYAIPYASLAEIEEALCRLDDVRSTLILICQSCDDAVTLGALNIIMEVMPDALRMCRMALFSDAVTHLSISAAPVAGTVG